MKYSSFGGQEFSILEAPHVTLMSELGDIYPQSFGEVGFTQIEEINSGTTIDVLSYTANAMPADALVTYGAMASAGMVLSHKVGIFHLQQQKSRWDWTVQIRIFVYDDVCWMGKEANCTRRMSCHSLYAVNS